MINSLAHNASDFYMVQLMPRHLIIICFIHIQNGSAFLMLAYSGFPGKEARCCEMGILIY